jgi:hypothetical protein
METIKTNKMKQTAVEFLVDKFSIQGTLHSSDISQAKEMEKQQIIDARIITPLQSEFDEAEEYYNETFNKK